jgi:tRNA G18 (ribose-2'-O)-methylase SpoU
VPGPIEIDSADDPRVAEYFSLRDRTDTAEYVNAETELVVSRLITSRFRARSFLLTPSRYERLRELVDPVRVPIYLAPRALMEQIVGFDVHRGVLASATRRRNPTLPDVLAGARRVLVLEGSNDLENIGAVARSARALGFDALVLDPTCADPYSRRAVRVSMGEILHLAVHRSDAWPAPLHYLADAGFETWALTPDPSANSLYDMGMPEKVALVAGAEGAGLTELARQATQFDVRIPLHHGVDSLNLGHALAIAMAATSLPPS